MPLPARLAACLQLIRTVTGSLAQLVAAGCSPRLPRRLGVSSPLALTGNSGAGGQIIRAGERRQAYLAIRVRLRSGASLALATRGSAQIATMFAASLGGGPRHRHRATRQRQARKPCKSRCGNSADGTPTQMPTARALPMLRTLRYDVLSGV